MAKPWTWKYQRALNVLLDTYTKGRQEVEPCPLCRARGANDECGKCPWVVMTGKRCSEKFYGRRPVTSVVLRWYACGDRDKIYSSDRTMKRLIGKRVAEIREWIKYWEETK